MKLLKDIGILLKKERIRANLTLEEVCSKANISYSSLWKIECGSDFKMSTFIKLCDLYKLDIPGLFTREVIQQDLDLNKEQLAKLKIFIKSIKP